MRQQPDPADTATIKRIPAFCGKSVVEAVRHGRLSIHAAHILSHVIEHRTLRTGEVAARISNNSRTSRSHSAHIRGVLLELASKGLVEEAADGRAAMWTPTPEATL